MQAPRVQVILAGVLLLHEVELGPGGLATGSGVCSFATRPLERDQAHGRHSSRFEA